MIVLPFLHALLILHLKQIIERYRFLVFFPEQGIKFIPRFLLLFCIGIRFYRTAAEFKLLAEIQSLAIGNIFRVGDITLVVRGRRVEPAIFAAVQVSAAACAGLLKARLPLITLPGGAAFMTEK